MIIQFINFLLSCSLRNSLGLVPYANSEKLATQFPKEQFELIQIRRGDHGIIWNRFDFIREQLILCLN